MNIVTGCITSLETGIYNVDIFDINNNGQKDSSGTAVTISTVQVFPPSQPSQPTSTDVTSTMYDNIRETPSPSVSCDWSCDKLVCFIVAMTTVSGDGTSFTTSVHTVYRDTGI